MPAIDFNDYWIEELQAYEVAAVIPLPEMGFDRSPSHLIVAPSDAVASAAVLAHYKQAVSTIVIGKGPVKVYKLKTPAAAAPASKKAAPAPNPEPAQEKA